MSEKYFVDLSTASGIWCFNQNSDGSYEGRDCNGKVLTQLSFPLHCNYGKDTNSFSEGHETKPNDERHQRLLLKPGTERYGTVQNKIFWNVPGFSRHCSVTLLFRNYEFRNHVVHYFDVS